MNLKQYVLKLKGKHTIETVMNALKTTKPMALKKVHELKKAGYLKTSGGGKQKRIYTITLYPQKQQNPGIYDIINKHSKIQIIPPYKHKVYNKKLTIEETIIKAVQTKQFRTILATLSLFNKVTKWSLLNKLAKEQNLQRIIGALYDTARETIKVKKMDQRTRKSLLTKGEKISIIKGLKSKDFKKIQDHWNVDIPFNKSDLMRYKE